MPRNIGGIPDSGISESRTLGIRFESADKESWRANEPDQVLLEPTLDENGHKWQDKGSDSQESLG